MRKRTAESLSPSQAQYILDRLRQDRRISATEIGRYLSDLQHEIQELEQRLGFLRDLHQSSPATGSSAAPRGRGRAARAQAPASAAAPRKARRRPISAATAQSRKIQGIYLSLIRQIAREKRPQFQKVAKEAGREEAIKKMRMALK